MYVPLQRDVDRPLDVADRSLVVALDVRRCAQDVNLVLVFGQRLLQQRPVLVAVLAGPDGILGEGADLYEAVLCEALLERDGGFDALGPDGMVDFDKGAHRGHAGANAFGDELSAAEGEVGGVIAGFGEGGVGEGFVEGAAGGGEVCVAGCIGGEEESFVEVDVRVTEGGEEKGGWGG